jgi:hypothetical protein
MGVPANESGLEAADMESRMDAIRLKQILGSALTEQELMCLQIEAHGFGCKSCSAAGPPPHVPFEA